MNSPSFLALNNGKNTVVESARGGWPGNNGRSAVVERPQGGSLLGSWNTSLNYR
ncbi:hypothetical protein PRIO_3423 [Paenibacillus riograndensis SBR5]|uniref:Uncharacterized protein n=1 Tax=Paenibacillus riograndensis SBR5 TaxID=1073571 RepID=A0A0E4CWZ7_9BACL|nr:hypothetical protein PRIO_3423 [Paenibacillus riograndensis SBR5]